MREGKPSFSAEVMAFYRAAESAKSDADRLYYVPLANGFLRTPLRLLTRSRLLASMTIWFFTERWIPGGVGVVLARSRYIDECLRDCLDEGIRQLVILGAGYDSRAYRFSELKRDVKVFEVDHPSTQALMTRRLRRSRGRLPKHVSFVPVDLMREDLAARLVESGYSRTARTLFIWEGVSACSRVFVEQPLYETLVGRIVELTNKLVIGDPTDRQVSLGPVINNSSYQDFKDFSEELSQAGTILTGGVVLTDGIYGKGYFCRPTLAADVPFSPRLWREEMFLPITTVGKVNSLDEAMEIANNVNYGLTAGFYGSPEEAEWFFKNIQAGVTYANRPQGATTGAWPGFQPFGGWKGSGSSGKNAGGHYYLPLYMHEQIQTRVEPIS